MKKLLSVLILVAMPLLVSAQTTVIGGSSGGGASATNDLTDVTISSLDDGDILKTNGSGILVDIPILAALGEDLTASQVLYVSGGEVTSSAALQFDGSVFKVDSLDFEDGGTKPTCDATARGYVWNDEGSTGVADTAEICTKDTDNSYYWKPLVSDSDVVSIDLTDTMVATTGDGKYYFFIDSSLNGYVLTDVSLSNVVPGTTSGALTIDLARCTIGAAICTTEVDMLSTSIGVNFGAFSTSTAAVIDTANDDVSTGQRIRVDVDGVAGGTVATGVTLGLVFTKRS